MNLVMLIHNRLSVSVLLFMVALAAWGFWNYFRGEGVSGSYQGALAIGEGLIVIEAIFGVILSVLGGVPARGWLHILYGIVATLSIPSAFAFTRGRTGRYEALIYGLIGLFLAGIAIRAQTTGAP
jgi:hypothetical protein